MMKPGKTFSLTAVLFSLAILNTVNADEVKILAADFKNNGGNHWTVNVTLKHSDTGWDHYANDWRIVDDKGKILAHRVLHHPHVDEQPFTRGLNSVMLPDDIKKVYIEAHDKKHGWTENRLLVDLVKVSNGHLRINAE